MWPSLVSFLTDSDRRTHLRAIVGKIVKTGEVIVKGSKTKQKPKARPPDDSEFGLLRPGGEFPSKISPLFSFRPFGRYSGPQYRRNRQ